MFLLDMKDIFQPLSLSTILAASSISPSGNAERPDRKSVTFIIYENKEAFSTGVEIERERPAGHRTDTRSMSDGLNKEITKFGGYNVHAHNQRIR